MLRRKMSLPLRLYAALAAACFSLALANDSLLIEKAEREINAAKYIVLERQTVTYKNTGSQPVTEVLLCHPADQAANRAFFEVVEGIEDDSPELLVKPAAQEGLPGNVTCVGAALAQPLAPGKSTVLESYVVLVRVLQPRPREIQQADPQRVLLSAPQHLVSPYPIASETTQVRLPSKAVESFAGAAPSARSGASVNFGPYADLPPWAGGGQLSVHFENNSPFAEATSLVREVQVSHWGNVYVEEWYTVKHMGARQAGEWSRLRFMQDARRHGAAAVRDLQAVLPRSAHSLYFRDEIGNISTSSVRRLRDKLDVRLQPRFPLFGGWQADFVFGYSLPLATVVSRAKGGLRQVEMPFSSPIQNLLVADLTVKVVLPEGSAFVKASLPFPVEEALEKKFTYLDTLGRPVVVLHKADVVPDHNVPLALTYRFSSVYLLQEPLLLIGAFFAFFCALIVCVRLDFNLLPDEKSKLA